MNLRTRFALIFVGITLITIANTNTVPPCDVPPTRDLNSPAGNINFLEV